MKAINIYSNVMEMAMEKGIVTNDELKNSSLWGKYWSAARELAKAYVKMNYPKLSLIFEIKGWDYEDLTSEFTMVLIKRYATVIARMLNPKSDEKEGIHEFNLNAYTSTMFSSFLKDQIKKYEIREISEKKYWKNESIYTPVVGNESLTLVDTLASTEEETEASVIQLEETKRKVLDCFKICKKQKNIGQAYVYIEDILILNGLPAQLEEVLKIYDGIDEKTAEQQLADRRNFFESFFKDYITFLTWVGKVNVEKEFFSQMEHAIFQDNFMIDQKSIYNLRSAYKKTLGKRREKDDSKNL